MVGKRSVLYVLILLMNINYPIQVDLEKDKVDLPGIVIHRWVLCMEYALF